MTETRTPYTIVPPKPTERENMDGRLKPAQEPPAEPATRCIGCGAYGVFYSGYCPNCSLPEPRTWPDESGRDPDPFGR